jgi:predicted Zn-dependent protease
LFGTYIEIWPLADGQKILGMVYLGLYILANEEGELASYGRAQESDADRLGMRLSAKSGYDPLLLASNLQRLEKDVEMLTKRKREFSFFDSHPMTPIIR